MVSCRTLQIAEPKALKLEKDYLAKRWNVGSFCICPNYCCNTPYLRGTFSERLALPQDGAIAPLGT